MFPVNKINNKFKTYFFEKDVLLKMNPFFYLSTMIRLIKIYKNENIISVRSAHDMKKSVEEKINSTDILCMCAAVADYTTECNTLKIKKNEN